MYETCYFLLYLLLYYCFTCCFTTDKAATHLHGADLSFEYVNGDKYRGDWKSGKKHGRGR